MVTEVPVLSVGQSVSVVTFLHSPCYSLYYYFFSFLLREEYLVLTSVFNGRITCSL